MERKGEVAEESDVAVADGRGEKVDDGTKAFMVEQKNERMSGKQG